MENKKYFLGLDIGTDSVGYAVTDDEYRLKKIKGEPIWGVTTFEMALDKAERRGFRTARRRLDRRKNRVRFLEELFAEEIARVDPRFFIRLKESSLWRDDVSDSSDRHIFFNDEGYNDSDYFKEYPTVHHLICELIKNDTPHDVRHVYLACVWLVAHRGHFLKDISKDNLDVQGDFQNTYDDLISYFNENGFDVPWESIDADKILEVINMKSGINAKTKAFGNLLFGGKIPKDKSDVPEELLEKVPYSRVAMIKLLAGGKLKSAKDIFLRLTEEPTDISAITLDCDDEVFAQTVNALGDDGELLVRLRAVRDAASLIELLGEGNDRISVSKVKQYETHKKDLKNLKKFVRKYFSKDKYYEIFRSGAKGLCNYVAYSGNFKDVKGKVELKCVKAKDFYEYLKKLFKDIKVDEVDKAFYDDMMSRIESNTFMPKQKTGENRIIPYQLYWKELVDILENAKKYLPFLNDAEDGITVAEKLVSIFEYRIPYFVGPLHCVKGQKSYWLERKATGRITPWNIEEKIDFDKTEDRFIKSLINACTYLVGEDVLPKSSILYSKFSVLNERNNLTVGGVPISVELKQRIFEDLFQKYGKVSLKQLKNYLFANGVDSKTVIGGIDESVKSTFTSYKDFRRLIGEGILTEVDAEKIIARSTYSENKERFKKWLSKTYPSLSDEDVKYLATKSYKDFGRLSEKLLTGIYGTEKNGSGEAFTILEILWNTNDNLMQILSDKYTFKDRIDEINREFCSKTLTVDERLDSMYISGAVKRPIIRTLDIISDVCKVMGGAPEKIFIEMARGGKPEEKGKRTKTRRQILNELYDKIKNEDVKALKQSILDMGEQADSKLQSDKLYLYYLQLGRCMYSGETISLDKLFNDKVYDIDHIYPQHFVKDDSIINNKVLVLSTENAEKGDIYPISSEIRQKMSGYWEMLHKAGLISDEKLKRLTRKHGFTDEERWGFINRQLVETRQSTKAVARLLNEMFPKTEIIYVKAGLVSEFRHQYGILKSRLLNDLHHAKDAYLNIVVGNVYNERFSRRYFKLTDEYSMKTENIFKYPVKNSSGIVWSGENDIGRIKKIYSCNHAHITRYAFCRKGGLFDQMPVRAGEGAVERKSGLPIEKYGAYKKTTASFFVLVKYKTNGEKALSVIPVELMHADKFLSDATFKMEYTKRIIFEITNKIAKDVEFPLGDRILKINTVFECDGLRLCLSGKSGGGRQLLVLNITQFVCPEEISNYIRLIEKYADKVSNNPDIVYDAEHTLISKEANEKLYNYYIEKLEAWPYKHRPANPVATLKEGKEKFRELNINAQVLVLKNIHSLFIKTAGGVDLGDIGGKSKAGVTSLSFNIANWSDKYNSVHLVDSSASGLFEKKSNNLLELL